jgi:phage terminase large subunit-like protein
MATTSYRNKWMDYAAGSSYEHFAWWCETYCQQWIDEYAGLPLILEDWQLDFFSEALAVDEDGNPYWKQVVLCVPRKNGKSIAVAAYSLYHLDQDEGQPNVILAASSRAQADIAFSYVTEFLRHSPDLVDKYVVRHSTGEVARSDGGGKLNRVASDSKRLHGANPSRVIVDELHSFTTTELEAAYAALTTAGRARRNYQTFVITTAGEARHRETSILGRTIDANEEQGEIEKRHEALTISRNHKARTLVFNYSAPVKGKSPSEWRQDFDAIRQANPASWLRDEDLKRDLFDVSNSDAFVLQLYGCVWTDNKESFLSTDRWRELGDGSGVPEGSTVFIGLDASLNYDTTAVAWAAINGDRVDVDVHIFSVRQDVGHHTFFPQGQIQYAAVMEFIEGLFSRYDVAGAAYDPNFMHESMQALNSRLPESVFVEIYPNGSFAKEAHAGLRRKVIEGVLRHRGDPAVAAHVAATKAKQDDRGWSITKWNHTRPIDAVVAMSMACWAADNLTPSTGEILTLDWDDEAVLAAAKELYGD